MLSRVRGIARRFALALERITTRHPTPQLRLGLDIEWRSGRVCRVLPAECALGTRIAEARVMMRQLPVDRTCLIRPRLDEREVIAALRAGDIDAWGEVYRNHRKAAQSAANRIVLDPNIAEDLTQEAFLILPQALHGFRGDCTLRTFIVSITHNLARHHLRAHFRRRRAMAGYANIPETRVVLSPEQLMVRRQLGVTITRALAVHRVSGDWPKRKCNTAITGFSHWTRKDGVTKFAR